MNCKLLGRLARKNGRNRSLSPRLHRTPESHKESHARANIIQIQIQKTLFKYKYQNRFGYRNLSPISICWDKAMSMDKTNVMFIFYIDNNYTIQSMPRIVSG